VKIKRFSIYSYNGVLCELKGFTTLKVWLKLPGTNNYIITMKEFMSKATFINTKHKEKKKKSLKGSGTTRKVDVYKDGLFIKTCISVNEAIVFTNLKHSNVYKKLTSANTNKGYDLQYNSKNVYSVFKNGKHLGTPSSKKDACKLLSCSMHTLNILILDGESKGRKVVVGG